MITFRESSLPRGRPEQDRQVEVVNLREQAPVLGLRRFHHRAHHHHRNLVLAELPRRGHRAQRRAPDGRERLPLSHRAARRLVRTARLSFYRVANDVQHHHPRTRARDWPRSRLRRPPGSMMEASAPARRTKSGSSTAAPPRGSARSTRAGARAGCSRRERPVDPDPRGQPGGSPGPPSWTRGGGGRVAAGCRCSRRHCAAGSGGCAEDARRNLRTARRAG